MYFFELFVSCHLKDVRNKTGNESEIRASECDDRIRRLVYRFVFVENSRIVRGGLRGVRIRSPAATDPTGDRRICLRFISNRN